MRKVLSLKHPIKKNTAPPPTIKNFTAAIERQVEAWQKTQNKKPPHPQSLFQKAAKAA